MENTTKCAECDGLGYIDEDREYGDGIMAAHWHCFECDGTGLEVSA